MIMKEGPWPWRYAGETGIKKELPNLRLKEVKLRAGSSSLFWMDPGPVPKDPPEHLTILKDLMSSNIPSTLLLLSKLAIFTEYGQYRL
jgi:hypothetical protein